MEQNFKVYAREDRQAMSGKMAIQSQSRCSVEQKVDQRGRRDDPKTLIKVRQQLVKIRTILPR